MKKLICIVLAMLLLTACGAPAADSAGTTAPAANGPRQATIGDQQVTFEAWEQAGVPTAGDYYLTQDVVLEAPVQVGGNLRLHLNGHNITVANGVVVGSLFMIPAGSAMTVYDEPLADDFSIEYDLDYKEEAEAVVTCGSITSNRSFSGKVTVSSMFMVGGELTIAGGHVDATNINLEDRANGAVAYVQEGGKFTMDGGLITGGLTWSFKKPEPPAPPATTTEGTEPTESTEPVEEVEPEVPEYYGYGGAVYVAKGGLCTINGGWIWRGSAAYGGNIYVAGDETGAGKLVINGGTLLAGEATTQGGNICVDGEVEITGGLLDAGQSYGHGGNIFLSGKLNMTGGTLYRGACDVNGVQNKRGGNLAVNGLYATVKITNAEILDGTASCKETHGGNVAAFGYGAVDFEIGEGTVITGGKGHRGGNIYIGHLNKDVPVENIDYVFNKVTMGGGSTTYRGSNICTDTKNNDRRILVTFNDCTATVETPSELSIAAGAGAPDIARVDFVINGGTWNGGGFNIYQYCTVTCNGVNLVDCASSGNGEYIENP